MSPHRILIVDDDLEFLQLLTQILHKDGFDVDKAATGGKALEQVRRRAPDLVLLDLNLPDLDGLVVLERILQASPAAQVVMMTGQGDIATAVQAMKLGAKDFLNKPFGADGLKLTLHSLLQRAVDSSSGPLTKTIIGESPEMRQVWTQISRYALPDVSILLTGESGTGKELFARAIHEQSKRRRRPFVALDCATLPDTLVESELFGHEKGSFTGAFEQKIGKFELAQGSTIFLDEIGNLPLNFQAKLLRVLQERCVERLGGHKPVPVDVRIVSATNLDLERAVHKGAFREDLYYRLAEVMVPLPALRERENDIETLALYFVEESNGRFGRQVRGISDTAWNLLRAYRWPGNVRELENVIKYALLAAGDLICPENLPDYLRRSVFAPDLPESGADHFRERIRRQAGAGLEGGSLDLKKVVASYSEEIERAVLAELRRRRHFTQAELCALLHIDPKTLRAKLKKYSLTASGAPD